MKIQNCSHSDYLHILEEIEEFWGSDRTLSFHHPMFVQEFRNTAYVVWEGSVIIGYLFGFLSQADDDTAYVHLAGVRKSHRRQGIGTLLYAHFMDDARKRKRNKLRAITTPGNLDSIRFHEKIGMRLLGEKNENGIPVIRDYSGPGQDRVVFEMEL